MSTGAPPGGPLAGLRIISLESFVSAPYGTMLLAGLGAEVIKVEHAESGGDASRHIGNDHLGEGDSCYFQAFNLNKRSITLDITCPEGREALEALIAGADALVENLRGNKAAELGLDYASLRHLNEALVCLHISGYGRDNARKAWPGFDYLMQAEAGLMSLTGEPGNVPSRFGVSIIDSMTGTVGMIGLLSSLHRAHRTGQGGDVDTNLFEVALHQLSYAGTASLNGVKLPGRQVRSGHQTLTPVQTFPTADGWIFVMCMTQSFWLSLAKCLGAQSLAADAKFATMALRLAHRSELQFELDRIFMTATSADWMMRLAGHVPVAPVLDVEAALDNPFAADIGTVETIAHAGIGGLKVIGLPLKIDGRRAVQEAAPSMGRDNEVLGF